MQVLDRLHGVLTDVPEGTPITCEFSKHVNDVHPLTAECIRPWFEVPDIHTILTHIQYFEKRKDSSNIHQF